MAVAAVVGAVPIPAHQGRLRAEVQEVAQVAEEETRGRLVRLECVLTQRRLAGPVVAVP